MRNRRTRLRQHSPHDVGTLWTMQRHGRRARCALLTWPGGWELRVLVDGAILLTERCPTAGDAFEVAAGWKLRMLDRRWQQIEPGLARTNPGSARG